MQSSLQCSTQTTLLTSAAKSFAMKKTLADQVRDFIQYKGDDFTPGKLALEVAKHQRDLPEGERCKRQNIEQLLERDFRTVRYVAALAAAMGTTVETLAAGAFVPNANATTTTQLAPAPAPHEAPSDAPGVPPDLVITEYSAGGAMGHGYALEENPPGHIKAWRVTPEWLRMNVPVYSSLANLCIVTGFGPSMKPRYNPGDPLLCDRGFNKVDSDGVYFFRVDGHGFIKQLQRIPTENGLILRAKSFNPDYDPFDITSKMDFEVFGKILTVWRSEQF